LKVPRTAVTDFLETKRLRLVPLTIGDADQIQAHFPQWDIVRFLLRGIPWPYPSDGAFTWCRDVALPQVERGEAWHWTMRLKAKPNQVLGLISLMTGEDDNRGFWIVPEWQSQGLASEAADAVTAYWFDVLKFPVLRAPKAVANVASRRISEKQGMRVIRTELREYVCGQLPAEIWEITADEWHARGQDATT
jgi:ribosomal-protein-alanine N-acetyltransferase